MRAVGKLTALSGSSPGESLPLTHKLKGGITDGYKDTAQTGADSDGWAMGIHLVSLPREDRRRRRELHSRVRWLRERQPALHSNPREPRQSATDLGGGADASKEKSMNTRNFVQGTSSQSAAASAEVSGKLRARIVRLARAAGSKGISLSETVQAIPDHKLSSITPRFVELVKGKQLVRVFIGAGKPTKRYPAGRPIFLTRFDEQTKRNVLVQWVPEFAPSAIEARRRERGSDQYLLFTPGEGAQ